VLAALCQIGAASTVHCTGKCTNLAFSVSSLHSDHVLEPVMTEGLLNLPECMAYQSTSIYTPDIVEAHARSFKLTR